MDALGRVQQFTLGMQAFPNASMIGIVCMIFCVKLSVAAPDASAK